MAYVQIATNQVGEKSAADNDDYLYKVQGAMAELCRSVLPVEVGVWSSDNRKLADQGSVAMD